MTAPAQDDTKLTATKAFFIGFFALALGWAGVLVAAVAVATEQTWSKGRVEGDRSRARRAGWLGEQRSWLEGDHQQRTARRAARQSWLAGGADPLTEPARPSRGRRVGDALRRMVANTAVAAADFTSGVRDGWVAGNRARRAGGGFREIVAARPDDARPPQSSTTHPEPEVEQEPVCGNCLRPGPVEANGSCADCNRPTPVRPATDTDVSTPDIPIADDTPNIEPAHGEDATGPDLPNTEGEPMTAPVDSNATVLAAKLTDIDTTVAEVSTDVDALGSITTELRNMVARAADLAHSAGMPTEAVVAVDAIQHAANTVDARIEDFSTAAAEASDQLKSATDGLRPVVQAEDKLHAAGADGRVFDTAAA